MLIVFCQGTEAAEQTETLPWLSRSPPCSERETISNRMLMVMTAEDKM